MQNDQNDQIRILTTHRACQIAMSMIQSLPQAPRIRRWDSKNVLSGCYVISDGHISLVDVTGRGVFPNIVEILAFMIMRRENCEHSTETHFFRFIPRGTGGTIHGFTLIVQPLNTPIQIDYLDAYNLR